MDVVALQSLVAGLLHGIAITDHPVSKLPWKAAHDSFYTAVRDGFDANLEWVTCTGHRTTDPNLVYPELFTLARVGLHDRGIDANQTNDLLAPIEHRWTRQTSPSMWKRKQVRDQLDEGDDLKTAIEEMQLKYINRCCANQPFVEW